MDGDRLYHDPDLVRFYDLENGGARADFDFCAAIAETAASVLDFGCGTGQLAAAMARDGRRTVFGVDPADSMLDIARARSGGENVTWVCGDARTVRLDRRFELIVLTGHAFQVFLTRDDRRAALETVAAHLSPNGRFVFDTRNPARREWEEWTPERSRQTLHHPQFGNVVVWNDIACDARTGIVTYETHYEVAAEEKTFSARARIAFPEMDEVLELLGQTGLRVENILGEWDGTPWHADAREIIVMGKLA